MSLLCALPCALLCARFGSARNVLAADQGDLWLISDCDLQHTTQE